MTYTEFLKNPWYASVIVFITQIIFIYMRTINVIYTTERRIWPTIISNLGISITWLLSVGITTKSVLDGSWQPILAYLIGGTVGTYFGIKKDI
nr:hypothetical protein [uncultured archaeon]